MCYLTLGCHHNHHPLFLIHCSTWLFAISSPNSLWLSIFLLLFFSNVPHFQTISLSWLSCSVKSPDTMLWVENTHRNTSPREVRQHLCLWLTLGKVDKEGQGRRLTSVSTIKRFFTGPSSKQETNKCQPLWTTDHDSSVVLPKTAWQSLVHCL